MICMMTKKEEKRHWKNEEKQWHKACNILKKATKQLMGWRWYLYGWMQRIFFIRKQMKEYNKLIQNQLEIDNITKELE